jgi:DNA-binding MarR family transcriptional regulator
MRQPNSADPWSTFLDPADDRSGGPGAPAAYIAEGHRRDHGDADLDAGLSEPGRRVLDLLGSDREALPIEQVAERLDMGLLDVAETVRALTTRGLIRVRQSGAGETVELTERESGD